VDIRNTGAVASAELPTRPSNEVVTEVAAVLGVKTGTDDSPESDVLAASGANLQPWLAVTIGVLIVLGGVALAGVRAPSRRRRSG